MLKNKIYKYFLNEIGKNFITILLTFTTIAWAVKAVNFLDLIVEDGYNTSIYFQYSILNITNIITRFVPLSFLLALTISIIKFERQQELLILWTAGLNKIKIVNIFLLISIFITLFQLMLSLLINPLLLNKSRSLLSGSETLQFNTVIKSNEFSDSFKGLTFYINEKSNNNEFQEIFIMDKSGSLSSLTDSKSQKLNTTIVAKRGFVYEDKLILFDGIIQTLNKKKEIKNVLFEKTELSLANLKSRTIKIPKIQETPTITLLECVLGSNNNSNLKNCSKSYKSESVQNLSRRAGTPLYIPLISIITSFLLIYRKEKSYNFLKKYFFFILCFTILILAEIFLKYTGLSKILAISYYIAPLTISFLTYMYLYKKITNEKVSK